MATILVLYASQEGQTKTIAHYVGDTLKEEGHKVAVQSVDNPPTLAAFDAAILGASIHVGRYADTLLRYLKAHVGELNKLPSAFFSVCLTAAHAGESRQRDAQGYIDALKDETGWQPALTTSFAGALKFSEYGFFKRRLMTSVAKRDHLIADAKHDYEFTDWDKVTVFAQAFSTRLQTALSAV